MTLYNTVKGNGFTLIYKYGENNSTMTLTKCEMDIADINELGIACLKRANPGSKTIIILGYGGKYKEL